MQNLINIEQNTINAELTQTVNARDLHSFLQSKQEFAHWIKDRINQYGFVENHDFLIILSKTPSGGRPAKEYHITIDMAKELSMVERNEKGKQARQYFIQCEKRVTSLPSMSELEMISRIASHAAQQEIRISYVEQEVEQIKQGTIPQGYQGYSYLQTTYGLSNAKSKQLVMAWSVPHKKVPHVAPGGQVTQMSVVNESAFHAALITMMNEAEQRGSQWYHPKMGRFSITGWQSAA